MYNRLPAFTAMKFDHLFFRQEIVDALHEGKHPLSEELSEANLKRYKGMGLHDEVVLKTALRKICSPSERNRFFFIHTVASHAPYCTCHIGERDKLIPMETSLQDKYLNSIHSVDELLRSFYENLPLGTLLVIYGDHTPGFRSGTFVSDMEGHKEFVPCFIHVVGMDLAAIQKVSRWSEETTLSVRDVHSYLRNSTERNVMLSKVKIPNEGWQEANTDTSTIK